MGAAGALVKCCAPGTWPTAPQGSVKCLKYPGCCSSPMRKGKILECQSLLHPSFFPEQDFWIQAQTPCSANCHLDTYTPSPHMQAHTHTEMCTILTSDFPTATGSPGIHPPRTSHLPLWFLSSSFLSVFPDSPKSFSSPVITTPLKSSCSHTPYTPYPYNLRPVKSLETKRFKYSNSRLSSKTILSKCLSSS